jgi:hypothetical protein
MNARIVVAACVACFTGTAHADAPDRQRTVKVFISADCKPSFYDHAFVEGGAAAVRNGHAFAEGGAAAVRRLPSYVPWDPTRARSMVYKDPRSSISLYVETDGRHVAAINADGKLLWVRNPYEESGFCPYRTPRPVIWSIDPEPADHIYPALAQLIKKTGGNANSNFVSIKFDSSQFGVLDEMTGDFFGEGQN